jgi:taurine--2-oxoglutarate transaminase
MGRIKAGLLERGLIPFIVENRIHVLPPCIVSAEEVRQALAIYDEVLGSLG